MASTVRYVDRPEAVRSTVGNIGGIIARAASVVVELEAMHLDPSSFAVVGGAAATTHGPLRERQAAALRAVLNRLLDLDVLVGRLVPGDLPAEIEAAGTGIWSRPVAAEVARHAVADSTGRACGRPQSVRTVLGYLALAGLASTGAGVPTDDPGDFAAWLDSAADNQAALGLIGVFCGRVTGLTDVPGKVHDGDLLIVQPERPVTNRGTTVGIVANRGKLYNNGPFQPDFGKSALLRIYRPISVPADV